MGGGGVPRCRLKAPPMSLAEYLRGCGCFYFAAGKICIVILQK